jgi:DNA mismatch endonuclease, patch repair protein
MTERKKATRRSKAPSRRQRQIDLPATPLPKRRLSPETRLRVMRSIRAKNTRPELIVRQVLWGLGARYRLHATDLPGRPDIVMRPRRAAVLVQGCFWHLHKGCALARLPKSRPEYWPTKLLRNRERDQRKSRELTRLGWRTLVVWECEVRRLDELRDRLKAFIAISENAQSR